MKLTELKDNETAFITFIAGSGSFRARLGEMGFVKGQQVKKIYSTPAGNPIIYELMGGKIALRMQEALQIEVSSEMDNYIPTSVEQTKAETTQTTKGQELPAGNTSHSCCCQSSKTQSTKPEGDEITLALVGNPNCGKTSLFNAICGGHERTGNYSGVTVNSVIGRTVFEGKKLRIVDLPGTYSLRAFSPEEAYVAHELESDSIDVVINVLDATNLERNLLLTLQLQERHLPLLGALNMYDELQSSDSVLHQEKLEQQLEMKLIPTIARDKVGIAELLHTAIQMATEKKRNTAQEISCTHEMPQTCHHHSIRQQENSSEECPCKNREKDDELRYASIRHLLKGAYERKPGRADRLTMQIDRFLACKWTAYPAFFLLMWFIFWVTFVLGAYPMDWIDQSIAWISQELATVIQDGPFKDLLLDGIIGGVGSVIIFLPNILILYFFISILEDSGYLARAAMLADPILNKMGLHGKSFIPMLMGFGCNVPAIMATRTIENHKSRLATMMVIPMMSCSARIPVYIVFTGAFFAAYASWVMFGLYMLGLFMAILVAWVFNKIYHPEQESHFIMEMPPYRLPSWTGVFRHTWEKGRQYLRKMGGIILIASIVVWALGYFPRPDHEMTPAEEQEQSYMGQIGHALEPVIKPLGYDWRMGVGILAGVGAKELMVSTLGVLYNAPEEDAEADNATDASQTRLSAALQEHITWEAALGYMVFALLYFPCLATIAVIAGESGKWKWAFLTAAYTTGLAYIMAWLVYRLAGLL